MSLKKFTITLDERQLRVINEALEIYSRLGVGKLEAIDSFLSTKFFERWSSESNEILSAPQGLSTDRVSSKLLAMIKNAVFGHSRHLSWGVSHPDVPRVCQESYDIHQVIRKALHDAQNPNDPSSVAWSGFNSAPYHPTNPDWPPVICTQIYEEETEE